MGNINRIQNAIMQLEGGAFQKLFDAYLYKKYKFNNIQTLGVQTGTNKPTKGTPDSYVFTDDEKYILINYGTVSSKSVEKIRADILSCFDEAKLSLPKEKIKKIKKEIINKKRRDFYEICKRSCNWRFNNYGICYDVCRNRKNE